MAAGAGETNRPIGYMPQLDGLRALAVGCVVIDHFGLHAVTGIKIGQPAVRLFFVLSGFLITSILLRCRDVDPERSGGRWRSAATFWIRRALRIFPIYYLTLAVVLACGMGRIADSLPYHALYLSNFLFAASGWEDGVSHFWSLAVEEQFYLFWPFVVLFLSRSHLLITTIAVLLMAPVARLCFAAAGETTAALVYPISCMDTLLAGALLAQLQGTSMERGYVRLALRAGLLFLVVYGLTRGLGHLNAAITTKDLALGGIFLWMVARAKDGVSGTIGRLLESRPARSIGKISYGIYIYHNFVPYFLPELCARCGIPLPDAGLLRGVIYGAVTLGLAAASWVLIEQRLLALKDRWGYTAPALPAASRPAAEARPAAPGTDVSAGSGRATIPRMVEATRL